MYICVRVFAGVCVCARACIYNMYTYRHRGHVLYVYVRVYMCRSLLPICRSLLPIYYNMYTYRHRGHVLYVYVYVFR